MFAFEYILKKKNKVFRSMRSYSKGTFRLQSWQPERLKPCKENSQEWLQLDEGDPGFQFLCLFEVFKWRFYSDSFKNLFPSAISILLHFPFICLRFFILFFMVILSFFINHDYRLIQITSPIN